MLGKGNGIHRVLAIALGTLLIGSAGLVTVASGQEQKKNWKDRAEFDLFDSIQKEQNGAKKLELLNSWKEKYPQSEFKVERGVLYITTYAALQQVPKIIEASKDLLTVDPKNFTGLWYITNLTPDLGKTDPDTLDTGEKAANGLLGILDEFFSPAKKPAGTPDDQWAKAKNDMAALANKTLGWVALQKKNNEAAEAAFKKSLEKNPAQGLVSYWLYTAIRATKDVKRYSDALWHLARAASLTGPGGIPDASRKQIDDFFVKAYNTYHGQDPDGLKGLRDQALASVFPPNDFHIESSVEISVKKENEFKKTNPQLAFWMGIKKQLVDTGGDQYWEGSMKGAALPGQIPETQFTKLKGTLISMKPAKNPKELVVGLENASVPEVTLKFETALTGTADPGTELQFSGIASGFTKDPFMVTFDVEKENLEGWPAKQAPAPVKKAAPAVKKAAPAVKKK